MAAAKAKIEERHRRLGSYSLLFLDGKDSKKLVDLRLQEGSAEGDPQVGPRLEENWLPNELADLH